jgi:hypothetical protein
MILSFYAGDSFSFTQHYSEYPSSQYTTASLFFTGPTNLTVAGVQSTQLNNPDNHQADAFLFSVTGNNTAFLKNGLYNFSVRVSNGTQTQTAETGTITIYPNPATSLPKEAICVRMIDLIEKALVNQLTSGEAAESISIAGRSISMMSRRELLIERAFWNKERQMLLKARTGYSGINQIGIII